MGILGGMLLHDKTLGVAWTAMQRGQRRTSSKLAEEALVATHSCAKRLVSGNFVVFVGHDNA